MRLQEAEKNNLRAKSKKRKGPQDKKHITTQDAKKHVKNTMKNKFGLNGSFRGAF